MKEVETRFPFSRQLLFSKFHLGGCGNCAYEPGETIAEVAEKHGKPAQDLVSTLNESFGNMLDAYISPSDLKIVLSGNESKALIDVREPWEFEICRIPGSVLLSQSNMASVLEQAKAAQHVIVICHHGLRAMNATLFMHEQGIVQARCLKGGTDAYSQEIDPTLQRY